MRRGERIVAVVFGLALIGAVISPAVRQPSVDGFPLSNYPMFATAKKTEAVVIRHVIAFDGSGGGRPVPPRLLGSFEVMQAFKTVGLAVRQGKKASAELCHRVARAVADDGGSWATAVRLEVRTDTFDAIAYFEGDTRSRGGRVVAQCSIPSESREGGP